MRAGRLMSEAGALLAPCVWVALGLVVLVDASTLWAAERPLLEEKHTGAGLACNACHVERPPRAAAPAAQCLTCHGGDYEKLVRLTEKVKPHNPHESHQGEMECGACHHVHHASVDFCGQCHQFGFTVP